MAWEEFQSRADNLRLVLMLDSILRTNACISNESMHVLDARSLKSLTQRGSKRHATHCFMHRGIQWDTWRCEYGATKL